MLLLLRRFDTVYFLQKPSRRISNSCVACITMYTYCCVVKLIIFHTYAKNMSIASLSVIPRISLSFITSNNVSRNGYLILRYSVVVEIPIFLANSSIVMLRSTIFALNLNAFKTIHSYSLHVMRLGKNSTALLFLSTTFFA